MGANNFWRNGNLSKLYYALYEFDSEDVDNYSCDDYYDDIIADIRRDLLDKGWERDNEWLRLSYSFSKCYFAQKVESMKYCGNQFFIYFNACYLPGYYEGVEFDMDFSVWVLGWEFKIKDYDSIEDMAADIISSMECLRDASNINLLKAHKVHFKNKIESVVNAIKQEVETVYDTNLNACKYVASFSNGEAIYVQA